MKRDLNVFLSDILEYSELIENSTNNISKEDFVNNKDIIDATIRRLEVIGEAVKNIPNSFRDKHPDVPWNRIAGFRDIIIHAYFRVNLDMTWDIIKINIPQLKRDVKRILKELAKE
jgi:uncharacterized protein with HEPN domain